MLSEQIQQVFNHLIQIEHQSAYLYLAMSNYFNKLNLKGFAHWLRLQHNEEGEHAIKLIDYVIDRGGIVDLRPIPSQPTNFGTPLNAFQQVLAHEQRVTAAYKQAYKVAKHEKDPQSMSIIQDILREQVEEEAQAEYYVGRLSLVKNNPAGLLLLDEELGKRE